MSAAMAPPTLISSPSDLRDFLSSIPPSVALYLDLEGKSLSRNGTLAILTILVHDTLVPRLIDVQTLGPATFNTPSTSGKTLRAMLEDPNTPKLVWDTRNDADALYAHYQVRLAGVIDVQLLENASRPDDKTFVRGLDSCVEKDLGLGFMEVHRWIKLKKEVKALMPKDVFATRPMSAQTMQYCANDVLHLPKLRITYAKKLNSQWMEKVVNESARRVADACAPGYEPQSEAKKLGPWSSGMDKKVLTMDEFLDILEDERMDAEEREMFGHDDFDHHDDYNDDYYDHRINSKDAAMDDTFDSCWEK